MPSIPLCGECANRCAETVILPGDGRGQEDALAHLCYDCLRRHPEFRYFRILDGSRKAPEDIAARRINEVASLREQGLSFDVIAKRFSVARGAVQRWMDPHQTALALENAKKYYATPEAKLKRDLKLAQRRAEHPLYGSWVSAKRRCCIPTAQNYADYGGRGIKMYPAWESSFSVFEEWINANLGPRPEGKTLDRIDNDGNYEPGNVRWATFAEQQANRRPSARNSVINKLRAQLIAAGLKPCA